MLIYLSKRKSVEDKISAIAELGKDLDKDAWQKTSCGDRWFSKRKNYYIVALKQCEDAQGIMNFYASPGTIFEASFWEAEFPDNVTRAFFTSGNEAYSFLKSKKQHYLDDPSLCSVATCAQIERKELDRPDEEGTIYFFNEDLIMYKILPPYEENEFGDLGIDSVFCYIPLPFKKGDIVRTINSGKVQYGVFPDTPNMDYFSSAFTDGDRSDMCVSLDCFFKRDGKYVFGSEHFDFLDLEICPDDELPEDQSILLLLRDVYRGDLDFSAFLFAITAKTHTKNYTKTIIE